MTEQFSNIEKILDRRKIINGDYEYKIKWKDQPLSNCTWRSYEQIKNLKNAIPLIEQFNKTKDNPVNNFEPKKDNNEEALKVEKINNENINNDETSKNKNDEKNEKDEYEENSKILIYENENTYKVDNTLIRVVKIRKENDKLIAVVEKMRENGEKYEESISTKELRSVNPWILLDFYESKIKFI